MPIHNKSDDIKALENIRNRLDSDVIALINLMAEAHLSGKKDNIFSKGHVPHLSLIRMAMPIAESVGALIYNDQSTTQNLLNIFSNELNKQNDNYGKFKNIIVMLYRHPLIHTDEMRAINVEGYHIGWSLDVSNPMKHLKVIKGNKYIFTTLQSSTICTRHQNYIE